MPRDTYEAMLARSQQEFTLRQPTGPIPESRHDGLYTFKVKRSTYRFPTLPECSARFDQVREAAVRRNPETAGVSKFGSYFPVFLNGEQIGYISYNGQIWKGVTVSSNNELLYDPRQFAAAK